MTTPRTGNRGTGASAHRAYDRAHGTTAPGGAVPPASSDPSFRGDPARHDPDASPPNGHMLRYLHLRAADGPAVLDGRDAAAGVLNERPDGGGAFRQVFRDLTPGAAPERARAECSISDPVTSVRHDPVFHAARPAMAAG